MSYLETYGLDTLERVAAITLKATLEYGEHIQLKKLGLKPKFSSTVDASLSLPSEFKGHCNLILGPEKEYKEDVILTFLPLEGLVLPPVVLKSWDVAEFNQGEVVKVRTL